MIHFFKYPCIPKACNNFHCHSLHFWQAWRMIHLLHILKSLSFKLKVCSVPSPKWYNIDIKLGETIILTYHQKCDSVCFLISTKAVNKLITGHISVFIVTHWESMQHSPDIIVLDLHKFVCCHGICSTKKILTFIVQEKIEIKYSLSEAAIKNEMGFIWLKLVFFSTLEIAVLYV